MHTCDEKLTLVVTPEVEEVAAECERTYTTLLHIQAPAYTTDERRTRAPIAVCAILDRSSSMAGGKQALVLTTMRFVVQHLKAEDQLAIVTYDGAAKVDLPLAKMDDGGKRRALAALSAIHCGRGTNISEGLFEGLKLIEGLAAAAAADTSIPTEGGEETPFPTITSIWLFSDGLATKGITDGTLLREQMAARIAALRTPCGVFTFGFGRSHDVNLLMGLSDCGNGMYYYVESEQKIPEAFMECLGGLVSVTAQKLELLAVANPPYKITRVITTFRHLMFDSGLQATVAMPDLYSEEARDILFEVQVAPQRPPHDECQPVLTFTLQYYSVLARAQDEVTSASYLRRPVEVAAGSVQPEVPVELDRQRNRVICVNALKFVRMLLGGQSTVRVDPEQVVPLLTQALALIRRSRTAADAYCQSLVADLQGCLSSLQLARPSSGRGGGGGICNGTTATAYCDSLTAAVMSAHAQQRGSSNTNSSTGGGYAAYTTSAQRGWVELATQSLGTNSSSYTNSTSASSESRPSLPSIISISTTTSASERDVGTQGSVVSLDS